MLNFVSLNLNNKAKYLQLKYHEINKKIVETPPAKGLQNFALIYPENSVGDNRKGE